MTAYAVRITEVITYTMHVNASSEREAIELGTEALLRGERAIAVEARTSTAVVMEEVPPVLSATPADPNQHQLF